MASTKKRHNPFYIRPTELSEKSTWTGTIPSLADSCRNVIVTHLERYPVESFSIVDSDEWDTLVTLRHERTKPKNISATHHASQDGRRVAAVSAKFLTQLEAENSQFAESRVADRLLWKYCVEFQFRRGGLTRPVELELPWPFLVAQVKEKADELANPELRPQAIEYLTKVHMNIPLLKDSGVGKVVKKAVKKLSDLDKASLLQLNQVLQRWMDMVERPTKFEFNEGLALVQTCQTWRQLFHVLSDKNAQTRTSQGKKMREIRKNLAQTRPKMVRVRPASKKQEAFLTKGALHADLKGDGPRKLQALKRETKMQIASGKRKVAASKGSFGDSVAFATGAPKGSLALGNRKRMRMPNGPPQQFMKRTKK